MKVAAVSLLVFASYVLAAYLDNQPAKTQAHAAVSYKDQRVRY